MSPAAGRSPAISACRGSFSIKSVAPALVPGISYGALDLAEGGTAQALLVGLVLGDPATRPGQTQHERRLAE